jgi:hypothetical protein
VARIKHIFRSILKSKKAKPYFLVIGAGRGGTSLLAAMLDYHSRLSLGFEAFSVPYLMGEDLPEGKKLNMDERLKQFVARCQESANNNDVYWGNKITTEQIASLAECDEATWPHYLERFIAQAIGNQKVIFIMRDGRTCVDSKMRRTGQTYELAKERWKTSIQIWDYLTQSSVAMHTVTYEDLLAKPKEVLLAVCDFLEVTFEEHMLEGTNNANMPNEYRGKELRQALAVAQFPKQWTSDLLPELNLAGYS